MASELREAENGVVKLCLKANQTADEIGARSNANFPAAICGYAGQKRTEKYPKPIEPWGARRAGDLSMSMSKPRAGGEGRWRPSSPIHCFVCSQSAPRTSPVACSLNNNAGTAIEYDDLISRGV
jgi:hypothetical protein